MPLAPGVRLGVYEVLALIGAGGMGEVYRARDSRLNRDVALKILPDSFALDPDRLARSKREAQVLASLNHSNIAAIYGFEESHGVQALVLELVEGPTLADRIAQGQIPLDEALPIARQIAEALEAAHEQGIIHRDLKPANIKVRADGTVKVLDFGLAKALDPGSSATDASQSPTITSPVATGLGVILGTAAYMSPEQARGKAVDKRADIWAFGCVLYEMLSGKRAFRGDDVTDTIAAVIRAEPDWQKLPGETPVPIRRLLRRCLQKDGKVRLHDAADVRIELDDASSVSDVVAPDTQRRLRRRERLAWTSALVMLAVTAATTVRWALARTPSPSELRLEITTPPTTDPTSVAVSPDGSKIVFAATFEGQNRLWIRSLDSTSTRPLPGTDRASYPFWSPDNRFIGFFADGKLQRIDVDAGSVQVLANANPGRGGSWGRDDVILFSPTNDTEVLRVSAGGGPAASVTRVERPAQTAHRFPQLLPDGRHFLYYASGNAEGRGVYVARLDGSSQKRLIDADAQAVYASSGHLLFVRRGTLFARRFDTGTLALTGDAFPLAEEIAVDAFTSIAAISTSAAGPVVYRSGTLTNRRQLVWFNRAGNELEKVGDADDAANGSAAVSTDARHVALTRVVNGNLDIWRLETARPILSRFTSNPANDVNPMWSPDGTRVVFSSARSGAPFDLYEKAATAGLDAEKPFLVTSQNKMATDWSSDGRFLLYRTAARDGNANYDLWAVAVDGDRTPISVVQTRYDEKEGQFSPDGKWVAYQSNESGSFEIYLQSFPGQAGKRRVSTNGGAQVRWRSDGSELFYIALDGRLMAVPLQLLPGGQTLDPGTPVPLFFTRVGGAVPNLLIRQQYAVSSDGQRFLMHTLMDDAASPLTVILNWQPRD